MKGLVCVLLLLETFVFAVQQQLDGGLSENEISPQLSSEDRRQNPPQNDTLRTETSTDSQQNYQLCFPDIHAALRELTAIVTEQKANIRALETQLKEQHTFILEELNKKNEERQIAFSAALMQTAGGTIGPFTADITLTYRNVFTNIGNAYNRITGIFTAPLKGAYMFRVSLYGAGSHSTRSTVFIVKNEERVVVAHGHQAGYAVNSSNGVVLLLEVGDVVYVRLSSGRWIYDDQNNHSTFSGYLLFPL
ncbi:Complement C1q-like protein 4 [Labeo rohita]|uniref:Complement C1q-like protein 4 n=1 Tax=Labeo rohita TaxID=84645 RepID=A0ABQ8L0E6_LABRO|nr:complement C1q-like protein 4 [Labeo rohita]KAI2644162.1 Complement C1q-like protein 4 [Labeo rohita]